MTYTSDGYDTSNYTEASWAALHGSFSGRPYSVADYPDCKVTALTGSGLTCQIAPGTIYGKGVRDVQAASENVTFAAAPGSGTRWDLVVARRNWSGAGGVTSNVVITGAVGARAVPTRLKSNGVASDDQMLALIPIRAGTSTPGSPTDLRTWGVGPVHCEDILAIDVADWPLGTEVNVGWGQNAARYEISPKSGGGRYLRPLPRGPVTGAFEQSITTNASGAVNITHNLGWIPTRFDVTVNVAGGYAADVEVYGTIDRNQTTFTTATVVVVITSGGVTRPYQGTLSSINWTAFEGVVD